MLKNPTPSPIQTIKNFLHQNSHTQLHITFAALEITNHQNGQFLNRVQRQQSRIILQKLPQTGVAKINVLDNMVFRFSFQFRIPDAAAEFHNLKMLSLPRPLDHGKLYVDKEKLRLSFRIDAPDPLLRVEITHVYQSILSLEQFCTPLCGQTQ
ncbi:hypothetical protein Murru_0901 [Allomuricauda ruestringensis DSM 13258]|uniref:Uncharacterized protein n=1 Tax=Allomuricauda ruestringensis (strain DSM 13258 / CIP 107369 / LMG 19739 / B1) TaxID=886377 RepID=G2PKW9_ALLRU|nr:hypothetical protein [Allomuricauda ruestringensis]AEM69948.1 hypothetical protein Murru_0901 [Allomuricauda ruestringensis DSM 13258]